LSVLNQVPVYAGVLNLLSENVNIVKIQKFVYKKTKKLVWKQMSIKIS